MRSPAARSRIEASSESSSFPAAAARASIPHSATTPRAFRAGSTDASSPPTAFARRARAASWALPAASSTRFLAAASAAFPPPASTSFGRAFQARSASPNWPSSIALSKASPLALRSTATRAPRVRPASSAACFATLPAEVSGWATSTSRNFFSVSSESAPWDAAKAFAAVSSAVAAFSLSSRIFAASKPPSFPAPPPRGTGGGGGGASGALRKVIHPPAPRAATERRTIVGTRAFEGGFSGARTVGPSARPMARRPMVMVFTGGLPSSTDSRSSPRDSRVWYRSAGSLASIFTMTAAAPVEISRTRSRGLGTGAETWARTMSWTVAPEYGGVPVMAWKRVAPRE